MRSHDCGCGRKCGPSTLSAVAFAALLVFTVTVTFLRSHVNLRSAAAELGRGERALITYAVHCRHFLCVTLGDLPALTVCGAPITVLPINGLSVPVRPLAASFNPPKAYKFHSDTSSHCQEEASAVDWPLIYKLALLSKGSQEFLQMLEIGGFDRASDAAVMTAAGDGSRGSLPLGGAVRIPDPRPGGEAEPNLLTEVAADGGPPPLSIRLAHKYAINNTIVITLANYALWDFVKSWAHHLQSLGKSVRGGYGVHVRPSGRRGTTGPVSSTCMACSTGMMEAFISLH